MTETTITRHIPAPIERVWQLWTTPEGISRWWAPDGFRTDVATLDLRPDGLLRYSMTAVGPEQVAFMEQAGMPLTTHSQKTFTEVERPARLAYRSLIDFVPDQEPYEQLTVIDLSEADGGTLVTMQVEHLHDDVWTDRLIAGRTNELENLQRVVS
ncbi:MAG: SRPBCC family protein [Pseudolysinimonas sp.]